MIDTWLLTHNCSGTSLTSKQFDCYLLLDEFFRSEEDASHEVGKIDWVHLISYIFIYRVELQENNDSEARNFGPR